MLKRFILLFSTTLVSLALLIAFNSNITPAMTAYATISGSGGHIDLTSLDGVWQSDDYSTGSLAPHYRTFSFSYDGAETLELTYRDTDGSNVWETLEDMNKLHGFYSFYTDTEVYGYKEYQISYIEDGADSGKILVDVSYMDDNGDVVETAHYKCAKIGENTAPAKPVQSIDFGDLMGWEGVWSGESNDGSPPRALFIEANADGNQYKLDIDMYLDTNQVTDLANLVYESPRYVTTGYTANGTYADFARYGETIISNVGSGDNITTYTYVNVGGSEHRGLTTEERTDYAWELSHLLPLGDIQEFLDYTMDIDIYEGSWQASDSDTVLGINFVDEFTLQASDDIYQEQGVGAKTYNFYGAEAEVAINGESGIATVVYDGTSAYMMYLSSNGQTLSVSEHLTDNATWHTYTRVGNAPPPSTTQPTEEPTTTDVVLRTEEYTSDDGEWTMNVEYEENAVHFDIIYAGGTNYTAAHVDQNTIDGVTGYGRITGLMNPYSEFLGRVTFTSTDNADMVTMFVELYVFDSDGNFDVNVIEEDYTVTFIRNGTETEEPQQELEEPIVQPQEPAELPANYTDSWEGVWKGTSDTYTPHIIFIDATAETTFYMYEYSHGMDSPGEVGFNSTGDDSAYGWYAFGDYGVDYDFTLAGGVIDAYITIDTGADSFPHEVVFTKVMSDVDIAEMTNEDMLAICAQIGF